MFKKKKTEREINQFGILKKHKGFMYMYLLMELKRQCVMFGGCDVNMDQTSSSSDPIIGHAFN